VKRALLPRVVVSALLLAGPQLFAAITYAEGLRAPCLQSGGAGRVQCSTTHLEPDRPIIRPVAGDLGGIWGLYRTLGRSEVRRCRLQPTCSLFAVQAVRLRGPFWGAVVTLARVQMEHGAQGGFLVPRPWIDGGLVYFDPVSAWESH
jgi:putative component of membrane protein insertase Oxa1/YidC/SpoIIIJ protein YidD